VKKPIEFVLVHSRPVLKAFNVAEQLRRQDLLRGGAKLKIISWGTHGELQGRVQQLLDD